MSVNVLDENAIHHSICNLICVGSRQFANHTAYRKIISRIIYNSASLYVITLTLCGEVGISFI